MNGFEKKNKKKTSYLDILATMLMEADPKNPYKKLCKKKAIWEHV